MDKSKLETLQLICATINSTREGSTTIAERAITMSLSADAATVSVYKGDMLATKINVACDSNIAMCRDILNNEYFR